MIYNNLLSAIIIALLAIPLGLGIAAASGYPFLSGIIATGVGGIIGGFLNKTPVVINGPAAGLIVVMLYGVSTLGLPSALAASMCAGLGLVVLSFFHLGQWMILFPAAVLNGMLSSIGVAIILKQIKSIYQSTLYNWSVLWMSVVSLSLYWLFKKRLKPWQTPFVFICIGIIWAQLFPFSSQELLSVPAFYWAKPNWDQWQTVKFWLFVLQLLFVQGLETLLSLSLLGLPQSRDLFAVGLSSFISASLGGLPVIAEPVRTNLNQQLGATHTWVNAAHAVICCSFVLFFSTALQKIPVASLACILIIVGLRLVSLLQIRQIYLIGWEQLCVFSVTLIACLMTDLLQGVCIGMLFEWCIHNFCGAGFSSFCKLHVKIVRENNYCVAHFEKSLIFLQAISLTRLLNSLKKPVILDVTHLNYMDHTCTKILIRFLEKSRQSYARGFDGLQPLSMHPLSSRKK